MTALPGRTPAPPQGSHWYYRVDRTYQRKCWYLGPESAKVRAQSPQANAAVRPPRPSKPVSPPISQAVPEAEPVEITAVEMQVAKDNLTVAMSPVETLAIGIPDQRLTEAALIARGRARQYSAIEVTTDVPSTRISSDPTTADRQPEEHNRFRALDGSSCCRY